jgi:hypothetical protein
MQTEQQVIKLVWELSPVTMEIKPLGQLKKKKCFSSPPARPSKPDIFFIFYFTQIQVISRRQNSASATKR